MLNFYHFEPVLKLKTLPSYFIPRLIIASNYGDALAQLRSFIRLCPMVLNTDFFKHYPECRIFMDENEIINNYKLTIYNISQDA